MEAIKCLREKKGLSQDELAKILRVDRSTVAKWETKGIYPRGEKVLEIADVFNCTVDTLYGREPPGHEKSTVC